jgi:hypothetical protein
MMRMTSKHSAIFLEERRSIGAGKHQYPNSGSIASYFEEDNLMQDAGSDPGLSSFRLLLARDTSIMAGAVRCRAYDRLRGCATGGLGRSLCGWIRRVCLEAARSKIALAVTDSRRRRRRFACGSVEPV